MLLKVKRIGKICFIVILIGISCFFSFSFCENQRNQESKIKEEQIRRDLNDKYEVELQEQLLKESSKTEAFISKVSNEAKFVVLTQTGDYIIKHDRTPENNNLTEWLVNSDISIKFRFTGLYTIDTKCLKFSKNPSNGTLTIEYEKSSIEISSLEIKDAIPSTNKSIFGEGYSNAEVIALLQIAREKTLSVLSNEKYINMASANLSQMLKDLAKSYMIDNITIIAK